MTIRPGAAANLPRVTIGLPIFNGAEFLSATLDILLAQSFTDFELFISDNASTDGTEEICRKYAQWDARIQYVRQPENLGALKNFFYVLDNSAGSYFMWTAHDDSPADTHYLQHLVDAIEEGYDYAFPEVDIHQLKKNVVMKGVMSVFKDARTPYERAKASLKINSFQTYALFRKDVLKRYMAFLQATVGMTCFNEGLFVHAISTEANGGYVPEARKIYRQHPLQASSAQITTRTIIDFLSYFASALHYFGHVGVLTHYQRASLIFSMSGPYTIYICKLTLKALLDRFRKHG